MPRKCLTKLYEDQLFYLYEWGEKHHWAREPEEIAVVLKKHKVDEMNRIKAQQAER